MIVLNAQPKYLNQTVAIFFSTSRRFSLNVDLSFINFRRNLNYNSDCLLSSRLKTYIKMIWIDSTNRYL